MSDRDARQRFEELEAGRILGDLDAEELREWKKLSKSLGARSDLSLELAAAAIETEFLAERSEPLPSALSDRLRAGASDYRAPTDPSEDNVVRPGAWREALNSPQFAWAIAAILATLLVANFLATRTNVPEQDMASRDTSPTSKPTQLITEEALESLKRDAADLVSVPISGLQGYDNVTGELVWSDARQEGFMTLVNLPANDPTRNQYQLWIVDPTRDDEPVDGGVFNVFPNQDAALIPIDSKVAVSDPQAFLITLEKPGGVVVSDQEVKVALAKAS